MLGQKQGNHCGDILLQFSEIKTEAPTLKMVRNSGRKYEITHWVFPNWRIMSITVLVCKNASDLNYLTITTNH